MGRTCAYTVCMANAPKLSPSVLRRAENTELSLGSLEAIAAIRARLDLLETAAMLSAREKGATLEDIAEALGLTHQAIYYRFRHMRNDDGDHSTSPAETEPV
jgi:predicted transcriptional regulator